MAKVFIYGAGGSGGQELPKEEKTVALNLASGNQVVKATDGFTLDKVTITKPSTLLPTNIVSGVNIAGVVGTVNVSASTPTLHTATITRSADTISISNPSTNGSYVTAYKIYNGGTLLKQQTSTSFSLIGLGKGTYDLQVSPIGTGFNDAPLSSSIKASVYSITATLNGMTQTNNATLISNGLEWTTKITPNTGLYLPEDITVTMGGEPCKFEYNSYSGTLKIASVSGDIAFTAVASTVKKLRRPIVELDESILTVTPPRYAKSTKVYIDNVLEYEEIDTRTWSVEEVAGATYGFELNDNDYYESTNKRLGSTYSLCKIVFNETEAKTITLNCISNGESGYDYGIISQLDKTLSLSTSDDGATNSTNVLRNFKGQSSTNVVSLTINVPVGEHFIYVKYRKDGGGDSDNDSLQFKVIE